MSTSGHAFQPLNRVSTLLLSAAAVLIASAISLLPIELAAGAVLGGIVAGAVFLRPTAGLVLLAFSVPYESVRQLALGGFNVGSTEVLVALTLLGWLAHTLAYRCRVEVPRAALALLALLGFGALSIVAAQNAALTVKEWLKWAELLAVWLAGMQVLDTPRARLALVVALLVAGVSEALIGFGQFFLQLGPEAFRLGRFLRAYGTFNQPNPYGGYLIGVAPLALAWTLFGWDAWRRGIWSGRAVLVAGGLLALLLTALAMSLSRGAWLGFGLAAVAIAALWRPATLRLAALLALVGLLVGALGVANVLPQSVAERLADIALYFGVFDVRDVPLTPQNWSVMERMAHWQSAWYMFLDHPWNGLGLGNYPAAYPAYQLLSNFKDPLGHAHNLYLNLLAEGGLSVCLCYLAFWLGALVTAGRVALRASRWWREDEPLSPPTPLSPSKGKGGGATTAVPSRLSPSPTRGGGGGERSLPRVPQPPPHPLARCPQPLSAIIAAGVLGALIAMSVHNVFDNLTVHSLGVQVALLLGLVYALAIPDRVVTGFPR